MGKEQLSSKDNFGKVLDVVVDTYQHGVIISGGEDDVLKDAVFYAYGKLAYLKSGNLSVNEKAIREYKSALMNAKDHSDFSYLTLLISRDAEVYENGEFEIIKNSPENLSDSLSAYKFFFAKIGVALSE